MKTLIRPLLLFVSLTVLISSCSKDEEGVKDRIVIDGTEIGLSQGFIIAYGLETDDGGESGSIYEILLTTDGVDFNGEVLAGEGQVMDIALFSASTIELTPGTYPVETDFLVSTTIYAAALDGDFDLEQGSTYLVEEGSVTLSRSGSTWTLKFEFTMDDGVGGSFEVSGSFQGHLVEFN